MAGRPGVFSTAAHTEASVTATTAVALAANESRVYALFVNDSASTMYLRLGEAAIANEGIRLNANGGSFEMTQQQGNLYTGAVNVIGTATTVLTVLEGTN